MITDESQLSGIANPFHFVFILDDSAAMSGSPWVELIGAYNGFVSKRRSTTGAEKEVMSVVMLGNTSCTVVTMTPWQNSPTLSFRSSPGTNFVSAYQNAHQCLRADTKGEYTPIVIFMTDGSCSNVPVQLAKEIDDEFKDRGLMVKYVSFGDGADQSSLHAMASVCSDGRATVTHANIGELAQIFLQIESSCAVAEYS